MKPLTLTDVAIWFGFHIAAITAVITLAHVNRWLGLCVLLPYVWHWLKVSQITTSRGSLH